MRSRLRRWSLRLRLRMTEAGVSGGSTGAGPGGVGMPRKNFPAQSGSYSLTSGKLRSLSYR
jgi:hypothetical protein